MDKCFECLGCHKTTGVIEKYTSPIHKLYCKRVVCSKCYEKWYICTLHVHKRWNIDKFNQANLQFKNIDHVVHERNNVCIHTDEENIHQLTQNSFTKLNTNSEIINNSSVVTEDITTSLSESIGDTNGHPQRTFTEDNHVGNKRKAQNLQSISEFSHFGMSKSSTRFLLMNWKEMDLVYAM